MPSSDLPSGVAINHWPDWGWCGVAASAGGITAIEFAQREPQPIIDRLAAALVGRADCPAQAARGLSAIGRFLDGRAPLPLEFDLLGTDFQKRVWAELLKVGPGTTVSYSQLAAALGLAARLRSGGRQRRGGQSRPAAGALPPRVASRRWDWRIPAGVAAQGQDAGPGRAFKPTSRAGAEWVIAPTDR